MAEMKFCGECGTRLKSPNAEICTDCGARPDNPNEFCIVCGAKKASANAVACIKCGNKFRHEEKKDPALAVLISIAGLFLLAAPGVGYLYLDNFRKAAIYIIASWVLSIVVVGSYLFVGTLGAFVTYGISVVCCLPVLFLPIALYIAIVYDIYLMAKGEEQKLPEF
jgi:uncharacterized membrane protein YvbJ